MKKRKLSPWFPASVKPVHIGLYQVFADRYYAWWDGKRWGLWQHSAKLASKCRKKTKHASQYKPWRGILK